MRSTEQQLKQIQGKLQQLLKNYSFLQQENKQLQKKLGMIQQQEELYQKNIEVLKQQVDVLKLGAGQMNETDKKEFEKRITLYLKEIDRCIALLSE